MKIRQLHSWNLTPKEAIALQKELACSIEARSPLGSWDLAAGADVSYDLHSPKFHAAVVVWRRSDRTVVEKQEALAESPFPYIPGLLSFRELPILLEAFRKLRQKPDVVMMDGHGMSHPRRIGIASHLGLWLDIPSIGCAKTLFVGKHREPGKKLGATTPLRDGAEVIGQVVRTRAGVRPIYVSVGHRIDLASAVRTVLECAGGYRLPEPTRQAHLLSNELRRTMTL